MAQAALQGKSQLSNSNIRSRSRSCSGAGQDCGSATITRSPGNTSLRSTTGEQALRRDFRKKFNRDPASYAAMGLRRHHAARFSVAGEGDLKKQEAFRAALSKANFRACADRQAETTTTSRSRTPTLAWSTRMPTAA